MLSCNNKAVHKYFYRVQTALLFASFRSDICGHFASICLACHDFAVCDNAKSQFAHTRLLFCNAHFNYNHIQVANSNKQFAE